MRQIKLQITTTEGHSEFVWNIQKYGKACSLILLLTGTYSRHMPENAYRVRILLDGEECYYNDITNKNEGDKNTRI